MKELKNITIDFLPPATYQESENSNSQADIYNRLRKSILEKLKYTSGIPEIVKTFAPDDVYKIVMRPENGELLKDSAGNLGGVFYKDGKIVQHAKLSKVGLDVVKAATAVASQVLLIHISMQLNKIEKKIDRLISELHNDRLSEIESGIKQYNQAMAMQDDNYKSNSLQLASQTLNSGLSKTIKSLKLQIEDIPDAKNGWFDNFFTTNSDIALEKFKPAEESFQACIYGLKTLTDCYLSMNEGKSASTALRDHIIDLQKCGIDQVAKKARMLPNKEANPPEILWKQFSQNAPQVLSQVDLLSKNTIDIIETIEIEFKPIELLENTNEKL